MGLPLIAQHAYSFAQGIDIDGMHFLTLPDGFEKRDGEPSAEVLAEFVETGHDGRFVVFDFQQRMIQWQAQGLQQLYDAFQAFGVQQAGEPGVYAVQRDADGNGFAVAQFEVGELFQFMCAPVAEIQRAGRAAFEGSAPPMCCMCSSAQRWMR